MSPLELVNLNPLMEKTRGRRGVVIGLIDGSVVLAAPQFEGQEIRYIKDGASGSAEAHGTAVASLLVARRDSAPTSICPDCTLLVRPIFEETAGLPVATPGNTAEAILDCVRAGARLLNLSVALGGPSTRGEAMIEEALSYAARQGAIVIAAAGNEGTLGSSAITRHPWVIPVAGCALDGVPSSGTNLCATIGQRGLLAPSQGVVALGSNGEQRNFGGTSAAAPFVTGSAALLWSEFERASAVDIRSALLRRQRNRNLMPPLLDASAAYEVLRKSALRN